MKGKTFYESRILDLLQDQKKGILISKITWMLDIPRVEVISTLKRLSKQRMCSVDPQGYWTIMNPNSVTSVITPAKSALSKPESVKKKKTTSSFITSKDNLIKDRTSVKFKVPCNVPYKPESDKSEALFEYAVKHLAFLSQTDSTILNEKMHIQWCNICFRNSCFETWQRKEYMSLIKSVYSAYFSGRKMYTFDVKAIERDYPQFFEGVEEESLITEILKCVKSELEFAKDPKNKEHYFVDSVVKQPNTKNIYRIALDIKDDKELHFYEGVKITLKLGTEYYYCKGLDYEIPTDVLYVSYDKNINSMPRERGIIYMDSSFILDAVYERVLHLSQTNFEGLPIQKFIDNETEYIERVDISDIPTYPSEGLDSSQKEAYTASLNNDITFIWGPPGTGKSFTLSSIIYSLYILKESTLVCSISNVAVDQLLTKFIEIIDKEPNKPSPGQIYRAGRTIDSKIIDTDYLFPEDEQTKKYRQRIDEINRQLKTFSSTNRETSSECLTYKDEKIELSGKLKNHTEYLINHSYIIFSTIANFILTQPLCTRKFDNLIVDEASMLSTPYLLAIAQRIFKRIILVGDPQQLGPISISNSTRLRDNIFKYYKVIENESPALQKLLVQRRSHPNIVSLINGTFYGGKLKSTLKEKPQWVERSPFAGRVIQVVNQGIQDDEVKYLGKTRRNFGTRDKVLSILEEYHHNNDQSFSIGVITPYRGQVKIYLGAIREKQNGDGFWESIKVGTIHTFQGSECDLIFIDLVEKSPTAVGRLFDYDLGEQLINVALSRAKHKLIIVGDTKRFNFGTGIPKVSNKVSRLLGNL